MKTLDAKRVLEAALICSSQPMALRELSALFAGEVGHDTLRVLLDELAAECEGRAIELVAVATGWRYQSRPEMAHYLARLDPERVPKYSRAVLETLAIIAYRQPVTRGDIEDIRGRRRRDHGRQAARGPRLDRIDRLPRSPRPPRAVRDDPPIPRRPRSVEPGAAADAGRRRRRADPDPRGRAGWRVADLAVIRRAAGRRRQRVVDRRIVGRRRRHGTARMNAAADPSGPAETVPEAAADAAPEGAAPAPRRRRKPVDRSTAEAPEPGAEAASPSTPAPAPVSSTQPAEGGEPVGMAGSAQGAESPASGGDDAPAFGERSRRRNRRDRRRGGGDRDDERGPARALNLPPNFEGPLPRHLQAGGAGRGRCGVRAGDVGRVRRRRR